MKKIAFLLFLVFSTAQLVPTIMSVFSETTSLFTLDEDRNENKANTADVKAKEDYTSFSTQSFQLTVKLNVAIHLTEKLCLPPCLEKLTPPPNFC